VGRKLHNKRAATATMNALVHKNCPLDDISSRLSVDFLILSIHLLDVSDRLSIRNEETKCGLTDRFINSKAKFSNLGDLCTVVVCVSLGQ
jgi:hypothetical protein